MKTIISIDEAKRYLQNAKDLLANNTTIEDGFYSDAKYVRMAGDTAWKGCLIALDTVYHVKGSKGKGKQVDIDDYRRAVASNDNKLLDFLNSGYNIMHLFMGYDGEVKTDIAKSGFALAKQIIAKCEEKIA